MRPLEVLDGRTFKRLAYLQNAYNISYTKSTNKLWTGSFRLPHSDTKIKSCRPFNLIRMWEVGNDGKDKHAKS